MYSVLKALLVLALLGFIAGIFNASFLAAILCALLFLIPAGIIFMILYFRETKAELAKKQDRDFRLQKKKEAIDDIMKFIKPVYDRVYEAMGCNPYTRSLYIFTYQNVAEFCALQSEGEFWRNLTRDCYCWLKKDTETGEYLLCLLESFDNVVASINRLPSAFDSEENAMAMIWRRIIPVNSILRLESIGGISQSTSVTGGDKITYRGISVNGIGFGEYDYDPIEIEYKTKDTRFAALRYNDGIEQTLLFPLDSIQTLIDTIKNAV